MSEETDSEYFDRRESEEADYEPEDDGYPNWSDSFVEGYENGCDDCDDDEDP